MRPVVRSWIRRLAFVVGALVVADQIALYAFVRRSAKFVPFAASAPPVFNAEQRASLERLRECAATGAPLSSALRFDADLGWSPVPGGSDGLGHYDRFGARVGDAPLVDPKPAGVRRLVVVGCSFTHGDEVNGNECWAALIDHDRDDVQVANLGVGGFGIDQALLRYRRDGAPLAPDEVWLGFMPSALPRLVSIYRPALRHAELSVSFKPRFRLDADGALALVENPARTIADAVGLLDDRSRFVAVIGGEDAFVARALPAYAPEFASLWHYSALGRLWITLDERRDEVRDPDRFLLDANCEAFRLAVAIARAFDRECKASGVRFRFVVLPDAKSLQRRNDRGDAPWRPLAEAVESAGIAVADASAAFSAANQKRSDLWMPRGHYSPIANRFVADVLLPLLDSR